MVIIRRAGTDDIQVILHHRVEMLKSMGLSEKQVSEAREATQRFLTESWDPSIESYLAVEDERVIGGCALSFCIAFPSAKNPTGKFAYLYNMFVEPAYRGRGVATSLVRHITQVCRERGVEKMTLHDTKMSRGIYEKEGFVRSENYYTRIIES